MNKKQLINGSIVTIVILIIAFQGGAVAYPTFNVFDTQMTDHSDTGEASWSADINDDGIVEVRGWILYALEKGVAGRIITITGTWGTDDGNFSGSLSIKNIIFTKFYGTYRGLFLGNISGENYNARTLGFLYNDWEVGYWKIVMPGKVKVQVVHIPFN